MLTQYLEELFSINDPGSVEALQTQFNDTPPDIITKYATAKIKLGKLKEVEISTEAPA